MRNSIVFLTFHLIKYLNAFNFLFSSVSCLSCFHTNFYYTRYIYAHTYECYFGWFDSFFNCLYVLWRIQLSFLFNLLYLIYLCVFVYMYVSCKYIFRLIIIIHSLNEIIKWRRRWRRRCCCKSNSWNLYSLDFELQNSLSSYMR